MLIFIVILFVACWAPLLIFNVLQSFGIIDTYLIGAVKYVKTALSLMAYFNRYSVDPEGLLDGIGKVILM